MFYISKFFAFGLRIFLSTNDFIGSYSKFTFLTDMQHQDEGIRDLRDYKVFVNERKNLAALVEVDAGSRLILIEMVDSTTLHMTAALTHTHFSNVQCGEFKSVESCLVSAAEDHDKAWPEKNGCLFKFVAGTTAIVEGDWKKNMRSVLKAAGITNANETTEETGPHEGKAKTKHAIQSPVSKPTTVMKSVMKKPAKR